MNESEAGFQALSYKKDFTIELEMFSSYTSKLFIMI